MAVIPVGSDPIVYGTDGQDVFTSDQPGQYIVNGTHTLVGGRGDDSYYVTSATKIIEQPGGGNDIATSSTSYVLPDNVETLVVWGSGAAIGNNQANTLIGSSQSNLLDGRGGNDVLQGGGGADIYQFDAASGHDTIASWNSSSKVRFAGYDQFQSLTDVQAAMTQVGDDVVLKLSANDDVTFSHTKITDFTADNFQYRLDTSHLALSFDDEFNALSTRSPTDPGGTWSTDFSGTGDSNSVQNRTLSSNGEKQLYVDPGFEGTSDHALGLDPFNVNNGVLTITAAPTPEAVKDALSGYDYTSGYLSSKGTFAQTYGYFEARLQLGTGQGAWPAFWMFRADGQWPPELDIMEAWNDSTAVQTVHTAELGFHTSTGNSTYVPNGDTSFHDYGMLWTADTLTWYLDGVAVFSQPTPADMHSPMFMVLNLAVSSQVQDPNFTSQMKVDYVRAYSLDDMPTPAADVIDPTTGHAYWGKVANVYDGFNAAYYLAHNPDVAASGLTPLTHYAQYGKFEGRLPFEGAELPTPATPAETGPDPLVHDYWGPVSGVVGGFNAAYYLAHNPDVAASGLDPLQHWKQYGFDEGRAAFDPKDTSTNPNHSYWGQIPGEPDGFNSDYYGTHNPDVLASGLDPLAHYLKYGKAEGRLAFDPTAPAEPPVEGSTPVTTTPVEPPVDTTPVVTPPVVTPPVVTPPVVTSPVDTTPVVTPPVDPTPVVTPPVDTTPVITPTPTPTSPVVTDPTPATHAYWGADPGEPDGFNAAYYAAHNPDVVAAGLDLLTHYEQYGKAEGRSAYDPSDVATATRHPYWGADAGEPDGFNAAYYAAHNPDVVAAGLNLLDHYERYGKAEGRAAYDNTATVTPPAGSDPVDTTPIVTPPVDTTPVVAPPADPAPVVTAPVDTTPVVTPPVDTTPVVTPTPTSPVVTDPVPATHAYWGADSGEPDGFNAAYYAAHNPDVVAAGLNLLDHYEQYGKAEGRLAYDPTDVATADRHPYWGALAGEPDGFNASYYAANNPDVVAAGLNLLDHYEQYGKAEGRLAYEPATPTHVYWGADPGEPDGFNAAYYAAHNPDVVASGLDLLGHYEQYGKAEGRLAFDPSDVATATRHSYWGADAGEPDGFNADYYAAHNPDVVAAGLDLLDHYERYGKAEGRAAYDTTAAPDDVSPAATVADTTTNPKLALDQSVLYLAANPQDGWANATHSTMIADLTLTGGAGNDLLDASSGGGMIGGTVELTGGAGSDTFVFKPGSGYDLVTDFTPHVDKLDVSALIKSYGAPTVTDIPWETGSMVHFSGGETILLLGVSHADATYAVSAHG